jgi:zinc resistance-associated protein
MTIALTGCQDELLCNEPTREVNEMKKVIVFSVAIVLAASSAWAFRGGCGMGAGSGMNPYFASTLGLTEDQKAQIQLKQQAFQEEIGPLRDKLFSTKMELRNLWAEASPDQAKITAKQKQIQALQAQIQEKGTQYQLECRQILTAEQQEKLGTSVAYRGGWGGPGRKMRGW